MQNRRGAVCWRAGKQRGALTCVYDEREQHSDVSAAFIDVN